MTRALSAPHLICTGIMMEMVMKNTARKTGIIPAFSERTPDTFETPCTSRDTRYNAQNKGVRLAKSEEYTDHKEKDHRVAMAF